MTRVNRRDDEDDWRFDENPAGDALYDAGYDPAGVGQWVAVKPTVKMEKKQMINDTKKPLAKTDVVTPVFRASYLNAFEARAADPTKPNDKNYGVEMWFRVKQTDESKKAGEEVVSIADLEKCAMMACEEAWGSDKSKWPKGFKHPFKKGEDNTGKNGPIAGVMIIRATRKEKFGRPAVVDQDIKDVIDTKTVYSGCYMRAKIHAYIWKHATGGTGVSFTLDMLQLVRDGEPLGNRLAAADAFEAIPVTGGQASTATESTAKDVFGGLG